MSFSKKKLAAE